MTLSKEMQVQLELIAPLLPVGMTFENVEKIEFEWLDDRRGRYVIVLEPAKNEDGS